MGKTLAPAADRMTAVASPSTRFDAPHAVEHQVRRVLTSQPGLSFKNLVVHRTRDGVCLTGVVESSGDDADVCRLAREASGIERVINRLIVRNVSGE